MARLLVTIVLFSLISTVSFARGGMKFKPSGMVGAIGGGFAEFQIQKPEENFKVDQGMYAACTFEKGLNFLNLYLSLSVNYLTTTGETNYNYTTLSGTNYSANDIKLKMDMFQAGLGLKFKLIDGFFFRPYVEGGGMGGWYTLQYEKLKQKLVDGGMDPSDDGFKKDDSLMDFGQYAEAGVEITFSESFGMKVAARAIISETKGLDTLDEQTIKYQSNVYYLTVIKAF
jgi:hypothetical protein